MDTIDPPKKTSRRRKDWPTSKIKFAIMSRGGSLRQLSIANGMAPGSLKNALRKKWGRGERIIANAIGRRPEEIWPSRYNVSQAIRISPRR